MSKDCCAAGPGNDWEAKFGAKRASTDLREYRRRGPSQHTARLIELIAAEGVGGAALVDVGGGVGAIGHALLERGLASATHVDASGAYLDAAREEAARRGVADRIRFVHGDVVAVAPSIEPADIVTLDRVICCDPRFDAVVASTAALATRLYGLVYPRDTWWTRGAARAERAWNRLRRGGFTVWVHPTDRLVATLSAMGFSPVATERVGLVWEAAVFRRA